MNHQTTPQHQAANGHRPTVRLIVSCPTCRCLHISHDPCPRCAHEKHQRTLSPFATWTFAAVLCALVWYLLACGMAWVMDH